MSDRYPNVSVIIPVHNGAEFLGEALESVLAQTYPNSDYEIIVADDGSTDGTQEVLRAFGSKVMTLLLEHKGVSAARNAAVAHSRAGCLALLDADDLWASSKLEQQMRFMAKHPECALVYSYSTNFTQEGDRLELVKRSDYEGDVFADMMVSGGRIANSTILMRRSVFDEVGGYDESLVAMEDYDLNLRISRIYPIGCIQRSLVRRRIHPRSFYSSGYDNQYQFQLPVYEKHLSDPEVVTRLGTTKEDFMADFVHRFIYKCIYDQRLEFLSPKLEVLRQYSTPEHVAFIEELIVTGNTSPEVWKPLIRNFEGWRENVEHKAALFNERAKQAKRDSGQA